MGHTIQEQQAMRFFFDKLARYPTQVEMRILVDFGLMRYNEGRLAGSNEAQSRSRNRPGDGDMGG